MKKLLIPTLFFNFILLGIFFVGNIAFACSGGQCAYKVNNITYCANNGQVYSGYICDNGHPRKLSGGSDITSCADSTSCYYNHLCYVNGSELYINDYTYKCVSGTRVLQSTNSDFSCASPNCKYAGGICASNGSSALYGGSCFSCSSGQIIDLNTSTCPNPTYGGSTAPGLCYYTSAYTEWSDCEDNLSYGEEGSAVTVLDASLYAGTTACNNRNVNSVKHCVSKPTGLTALCSPTGTSTYLSWNPINNASFAIRVDKQDTPTNLWKNNCDDVQYEGDVCVNPQADYSGIQWGYGGIKTVSGDYDGDGKSDLAVWDPTNGDWYIRPVVGPAIAWKVNWGYSANPTLIPVPGDYNDDGKSDLALWDPTSHNWYIGTVSGTTIAWAVNWGFNTSSSTMPLVPVSGDYNGDGNSDLALWNPIDGFWYIANISSGLIRWGSAGMTPVPGDYDGDGKSDLALWNSADGKWYIQTISGTQLAWAVQHGAPGMKPSSGDYDGDGKSDLALWDPNGGLWYIAKLNANGSLGPYIAYEVQFGGGTMIPVPGDYNGDGKSDMGLWNKSSDYRWYIKDAPDMQNNFSLQTINNSIYKWWIHAVVNGITSEAAQGDDFTCGVLPITASCSISPSSSDIGQMVTWTATSTGGLVGSLTYSWQGTGLAGKNTRIATTTYSTSGIYYATTTVSDGVSTSTVGCIGDVGETVCSGTCCSNNCACVGSCNPAGVCGGAAGEYDFSATEYRSGGPCSPPSTLSGSWSGYLPSPGATSTWQCLGANGGDSTTCYAYHSNKITDSNLNCSLSLTSPLNNPSSVNVNTNTQWTVSSVSSLDLSNSQYTKAWSSTGSGSVTGSNVWNKIFTTIGQKTVGVTVSTDNTTGVECTKNINVIQAGGGAREF